MTTTTLERRRILVIDDNDAIHGDFRKTLVPRSPTEELAQATAALFDEPLADTSDLPDFDVHCASQGREGLDKVRSAVTEGTPYALAFVDMRMPPGWDGVETIQHLWEADPELQVVICTAYSDYSWEEIRKRLGSSDRYLILKKPFDPMEVCQLASSLSEKWKLKRQANLKLTQLESMVKDRTTELRNLALNDPLTALPNRACFQDLLTQACAASAADPNSRIALHFIDFDRFKLLNDSLGHEAGDAFLKEIANRLRTLFNQHPGADLASLPCVAARLGGDEFVILQRNLSSTDDATALAQQTLNLFAAPFFIAEQPVHGSASIGIALSSPGAWGSDLLREADSAMYAAKAQGKARFALFDSSMHQTAVTRMTLENDMRAAIDHHQLVLHYQPIVSMADGSLTGFEALVRWNHPTRGLIPPAEFIPIAEETNLIIPLGNWVLTEALRQLAQWTRDIPAAKHLHISVNCSRLQLRDPTFPDQLKGHLERAGIAPERLNLEITESMTLDDPDRTRRLLDSLRALRVGLEMDDFGTGYSSLNCLHRMPLTVLKIDRSFIGNVSQRRDYAAVINAIIQLAHNLHMKVIAEGVESPEHTAVLCALDCDMAQGFFFSKPLPAEGAEQFIRKTLPA